MPCPTLCSHMNCSTPGFPVLHCLPEFAQILVYWVDDAIQPSHPLLPPSPIALNLSQNQGFFQWVSSLHQVAKILELQLQHQSFNEYSGLISFMIDWLDLLAVQVTLESLLQHHSSIRNTMKQRANYFWSLISLILSLYSSKCARWRAKNSTDQAYLCFLGEGSFLG